MGIYDTVHGYLDKLPKDPLGTPGISGSDNPLDILTGKTSIGPEKTDTSGLKDLQNRAFSREDALDAERANFAGLYNPAKNNALGNDQFRNIDDLFDAAAGRVPSPAEIQLKQQSGLNAGRQFGLAAALQGRNPGAALRSGRLGSQATLADTNIQAAMLRAKEQQDARNMLVQALHAARGDEFDLLRNDTDWRKSLLGESGDALDSAAKAAAAKAEAEAKNTAAQNQFNGDLFKAGASIFSDERMKTDVKPADLDTLADSLKGFRFRYKDKANGDGERVGIMAQDAAKGGPAGKRMVNLDGNGKMRLDVGNAVGAALAMSAKALRESKQLVRGLGKAA